VVTPRLERAAALASPIGALGLDVVTWDETDDPYALTASLIPQAQRVAVDDRMWAVKALALQAAMPAARQGAAGVVLRELRMRKDASEVEALRRAGAAIDRVHARVPEWLRPGRTERQVGKDIADAILAEGHASVDFVIVGSGPNGASPHHELSDRVLQAGDAVVVDIGGAMPDGYCSDSTRTYAIGDPGVEFTDAYAVLQAAQEAGCAAARPGVRCEEVDEAARAVLREAALGDLFLHRTGHGIGLETHEDPYLVVGNPLPLEPGMAFSVEPGFYREGRHGARIEDIVVCTEQGSERLNLRPRELVVVDA
jgi:Xaa-Pro aminopeptidase